MIQNILAEQKIPLTDILRKGAINELAENLSLARQTVSNILKGFGDYSEETSQKVVSAALEMIERDTDTAKQYAENLKKQIAA